MVPVMSVELHDVLLLILVFHGPAFADGGQRDATTYSLLLQHGARPSGVERLGVSSRRRGGAPRGKARR